MRRLAILIVAALAVVSAPLGAAARAPFAPYAPIVVRTAFDAALGFRLDKIVIGDNMAPDAIEYGTEPLFDPVPFQLIVMVFRGPSAAARFEAGPNYFDVGQNGFESELNSHVRSGFAVARQGNVLVFAGRPSAKVGVRAKPFPMPTLVMTFPNTGAGDRFAASRLLAK